MTLPRLILASTSPFRKALMDNAGLSADGIAPTIDERTVEAGLQTRNPVDIARALSEAKALDVSNRYPDAYVIGGDQTLSLGNHLFHKPKDRAEAAKHLRAFSGKTHHLNSGVALARGGTILWSDVVIAAISIRPLTDAAIARYLDQAGDSVTKSVGAYQVEGVGVQLFERIEGDHFTIVGLPLIPLLAALRQFGAINHE